MVFFLVIDFQFRLRIVHASYITNNKRIICGLHTIHKKMKWSIDQPTIRPYEHIISCEHTREIRFAFELTSSKCKITHQHFGQNRPLPSPPPSLSLFGVCKMFSNVFYCYFVLECIFFSLFHLMVCMPIQCYL